MKRKKIAEDHSDKFYASDNEETYHIGPYDTAQEAIAEFMAMNESAKPLVVGRSTARYIEIDGKRLIDDLYENFPENAELYEDAMNGWCQSLPVAAFDELSDKLTEVLIEWLGKHKQDRCWNCIEQIEYTEGREDVLNGKREYVVR